MIRGKPLEPLDSRYVTDLLDGLRVPNSILDVRAMGSRGGMPVHSDYVARRQPIQLVYKLFVWRRVVEPHRLTPRHSCHADARATHSCNVSDSHSYHQQS